MRYAPVALLLTMGMLVAGVVGCAPATVPPGDVMITGSVADVSSAARLIVLAEPVEGFSNVVLASQGRVLDAVGAEVTLDTLQAGQRIQATGKPGGQGALLATVVQLLEQPTAPPSTLTPTPAPATATPAPTSTPAPTATPTPLPHEIRLDAPQEGAQISSPVQLRGWVSVSPFEATLVVRIYGPGNVLLAETPIMVDAEMGQPGMFEGEVTFPLPAGGSGAVEVLELSPLDGSVVASARVAVTFPGVPETVLSGTIAQVHASARVLTLADAVEGMRFVAWTDTTTIVNAVVGGAGTLLDLQPGVAIQAFGSPVGSDTLLASRVVVVGAPTPTTPRREIRLDAPQEGAAIANPVRVRGWVSVSPFENTLVVRITDAQGNLLVVAPIMVDAEMGQPGTFDAQIRFIAPADGTGQLEVVELSPVDGSVVVAARVGVRFAGAEIVIAGTVAQVLPSARLINLAAPVEGFSVIALTAGTRILAADGSETTLQALQPGMQIEAAGRSEVPGALIASVIRIR